MISTRFPLLGAIAVIAVMIMNCRVAVAGPNQTSADYVMPGCRDAASLITFSNSAGSEEQLSVTSFCAGIVIGLSFMGQPYGICVPTGTTSQQVVCATAPAAWRCSTRLLVSLLGLVVVMHVFLCTIGSAFRHPIPFRNPRRLVKRFVSAPFLF